MATAPLAPSPSTGDSSNSSTTAAKKSTSPQPVEQSQNRGDGTTTYSDPSGAIFSLYLARASKFDDENVENWKGGADSILVFTGLFSSTVASLIAVSYPNLQPDPNTTTESLLAQISRQLSSAFPNGTSPAASLPTQGPFSPSATVVFINSVWFLSLVLSLTCALIATLLQQWARRYLQMIQRNHAPHDRAHIREYFSRGARKFHIFGLVETLPLLLLVSVFLFFAGLIAFAFHANHTVAWFTVGTVAFCSLSYIALTLMPLIYHDCPYHTPFTSFLWYSAQIIPWSLFSVLYCGAKQFYDRWGAVSEEMVESFRRRYESKAKSFSEGMTSMLENSAKLPSMDIYKETLVRTLYWLSNDGDLEEFVDGIPGLCESKTFATPNHSDTRRTIPDILAALPGPTGFHASLPWSIIQLAQRAFASNLPQYVQKRRTRACLKALYYTPGAIRDLLAPFAAEKTYASEILPLLNSPESLEVIKELQNTPNDDVALSVQCVAAVVTAHMITTPPATTPNNIITGDGNSSRQFLDERLDVVPEYHDDRARLQNIVRFLREIKVKLGDMNKQWWSSSDAELIRRELFTARNARTEEYRTGRRKFDQRPEGDRASSAFVPVAQQDLITLTLEILARGPVTDVAELQREAFRDAYEGFIQVAFTRAKEQAIEQRLGRQLEVARVLSPQEQTVLIGIENQASDSTDTVKRALGPVMQGLWPQTNNTHSS